MLRLAIILIAFYEICESSNDTEIAAGKLIFEVDNYDLPANDEARLVHTLVNRYQGFGLARPVAQVNKTLDVMLQFTINEFLGIEELTGTMKVTAVIVAVWQDDLLRWDPDKFHQLKAVPMKTHDVFLPTIVKDGNGGTQASIFMTGAGQNDRDINSLVWVQHTGQIEAKVTGPFVSSCRINLDDFPFDSQTCRFMFKSWRFNNKRITIHQANGQKLGDQIADSLETNINANPNWLMHSVTSTDKLLHVDGENFSAVVYEVVANRRSDYYTWNVLLPSFAMAVLLLSTFFMPFGPERSMFCITLVLTMNLFQQALNSKLPVTSEVIPYVRMTTLQVMMGIAITIESASVWWIAAKNKRSAVPSWLRALIPKLRRNLRLEKSEALIKAKADDFNVQKFDAKSLSIGPTSMFGGSVGSRLGGVRINGGPVAPAVVEEFEVWGEWLHVAQLIDLIFLIMTITCMVTMPVFFYRHRI